VILFFPFGLLWQGIQRVIAKPGVKPLILTAVLGIITLWIWSWPGLLVVCLLVWLFKLFRQNQESAALRGRITQEEHSKSRLIFGFQEEWRDFEKRNALFLERFPRLEQAITTAFTRDAHFSEPIDKFVLMFGRVCVKDFFEILLCCGNGSGHAAQKLLRGLYERAVTLRYLHEHPEEIENFLDYYHVSQRKLMIACENSMGKGTFSPEQAAEIEREFEKVKDKFMVTDFKKCGTERLNHTWSTLDFVAMANQTAPAKLTVPGYFIPLRQAHATVASMVSRMTASENDGISFADTAQRKEADQVLRVSHNIFLNVLRVQEEHFKVPGLNELNEICLQDFVDIWQKH